MTAVLDASALLALLKNEAGGDVVEQVLLDEGEPPSTIVREITEREFLGESLLIYPLDDEQAHRIAESRNATRPAGPSLADRAYLALAETLELPALTADRAWAAVATAAQLRLIG